jgi:hypothetical protein
VFLDFIAPDCHVVAALKVTFSRGRRQSCVYFFTSIVVLIDAASRELSNGGHIVHFDYFDPTGEGGENLAVGWIFKLPVTF